MESIITVPVITAIVYAVIDMVKTATGNSEKFLKLIPLVSAVLGIIIGVISFYFVPGVLETANVFIAIVIGAASGLAATGTNQVIKQLIKDKKDEQK